MKIRPTLSLKILSLLLIPTLVQLVCLVSIVKLQEDADIELKNSVKAEKIANALNQVSDVVYDSAARFGNKEIPNQTDSEEQLLEAKDRYTKCFETIKELTTDNESLHKQILNSERAMNSMFETCFEIKSTPDTAQNKQIRKDLWQKLRRQIRTLHIQSLIELQREVKKEVETRSENHVQLRSKAQKVALLGACVTVFFAVFVAWMLLQTVLRRLNTVNENAARLAGGLPLHERVGGNDEITALDKTFHEMAKALKDAANKERAIVENAIDFICSIDEDGRFGAANPASKLILGCPPEDLLSAHVADFVAEETNFVPQLIQRLSKDGDVHELAVRMRKKDGTIVHTVWSVHWSTEDKTGFCVIHDVTDRKKAEELKQEVMAMITHDLRTPLTTVGNVFHLLGSGKHSTMDSTATRYVDVGKRQLEKMSHLVTNMLDLERIDAGHTEIITTKVTLADSFSNCATGLALLAEEKQVNIEWLPTMLSVDADNQKLDRILTNLVFNAIKFSPPEGKITMSAAQTDDQVEITITDQGRGIHSDQIEKIFERFHQVKGDGANHKGSGLGLTICKAFVELHGGRIWVDSAEGKGSSFHFTVPLAKDLNGEETSQES